MRENLNCHCHICRVERHLFTAIEQFPGPDRFRKITTISPVLATFADARTLIGHLHSQKRGEYRSPSPSEVLCAIIKAGRDIGDPEMSQSVLVLAFMPTIHRTYREIRAWFQELTTEDVAQQTFLLFLELAASTAAGLLGGQLSFALARSLHRNTLRWPEKSNSCSSKRIVFGKSSETLPSHPKSLALNLCPCLRISSTIAFAEKSSRHSSVHCY